MEDTKVEEELCRITEEKWDENEEQRKEEQRKVDQQECLTKLEITWKESLTEEFSRTAWPGAC